MKIYIASDHAGFEMKNTLVSYIQSLGYDVEDMGAYVYDRTDDYPDFIIPCGKAISEDAGSVGIVLGGSGQGEAIVANRIKGIRAVVYYGGNTEIPKLAREHNDANVLSLGARFVSVDEAKEAVQLFLSTDFSHDERHIRRITKIDK